MSLFLLLALGLILGWWWLLLLWFLFGPVVVSHIYTSVSAVSITDQASLVFGGSEDPAALGVLYSIGAIGKESNGAITKAVTDLLSVDEFGVAENRIYLNFFDMPRANVGWSRRTFAG